jgi:hypothetical protein
MTARCPEARPLVIRPSPLSKPACIDAYPGQHLRLWEATSLAMEMLWGIWSSRFSANSTALSFSELSSLTRVAPNPVTRAGLLIACHFQITTPQRASHRVVRPMLSKAGSACLGSSAGAMTGPASRAPSVLHFWFFQTLASPPCSTCN